LGKENTDEIDLQNLDKEESVKKVEIKKQQSSPASTEEESNENDNNYSENEEAEVMKNYPGKMPLELDLSDLAAALLQNNKKSRMNCVVERKHAEEFVDSPSKTVTLPFGMNLTTDPKKARITGERISIYCESGNENKNEQDSRDTMRNNNREQEEENDDDSEPIRPMFIPYQRIPIPFGQIPQRFPLTHMPQRMMPPMMQPMQQMQRQPQPQNMIREMPPPFQHLPFRPPMPPQVMQAPHPESRNMMEQEQPQQQTVRIHVQQVPFREIHVADDVPMQIPAQHQELPQFQIQRLPLGVALQRAGITPDDLSNIQRMAEERISEEFRRLAAEEAADFAEINNNSDEDETAIDTHSSSEREQAQREQAQREQAQREQAQREQAQREQVHREQAQREQAQREQAQREQVHREQVQREQAQREQAQREQAQREQAQREPPQQQQSDSQSEEVTRIEQVLPQRLILQPLPEQPRDTMTPPMADGLSQLMQFGRAAFGRSLAQPVRIPVPMMQPQAERESSSSESERPHFVQPRSV